MRTFHAGGIASVGGDITQGLPRVEEVFEKRTPKNAAIISHIGGTVGEIRQEEKEKILVILPEGGSKGTKKKDLEYSIPMQRMLSVSVGDKIERGQLLTDGSIDITDLFKYAGKEAAQAYIINEVTKIYELQGVTISRKHLEIIVRQMFSRRRVKTIEDSSFAVGDVIEEAEMLDVTRRLKDEGKVPPTAESLVLGITEVSLSRKSFLSASSFQNTTRILINAAVRGSVDRLKGLKENVIIGRLIPAGTGFNGSPKQARIIELQQSLRAAEEPRREIIGEEESVVA